MTVIWMISYTEDAANLPDDYYFRHIHLFGQSCAASRDNCLEHTVSSLPAFCFAPRQWTLERVS